MNRRTMLGAAVLVVALAGCSAQGAVVATTITEPGTTLTAPTVTITQDAVTVTGPTRTVTVTASPDASNTSTTVAASSADAIFSSTPAPNSHGYVPKKIGELAGLTGTDGTPIITFKVTGIQLDPKCTAGLAEKASHGHFLAVAISASALDAYDPEADGPFVFDSGDFKIISSDGVIENDTDTFEAETCLRQSDMLPSDNLVPGTKIVGTIVLDTKNLHGSVVFAPSFVDNGGWEWSY